MYSERMPASHAGPELYILSPLTENFDAFRLENRPSWSWTTDCWPPHSESSSSSLSVDWRLGGPTCRASPDFILRLYQGIVWWREKGGEVRKLVYKSFGFCDLYFLPRRMNDNSIKKFVSRVDLLQHLSFIVFSFSMTISIQYDWKPRRSR